MMARLKFVGASPKILTFWKNTEQLQTIFNYFSEKVCITDQNYLYRPNCHHWARLELVWASPRILTFWKNTDQLQTIF